ncbi:hypothetical protein ONZ45_g747 [Pleurotus djamor]|nr:hypothetical protein ONZ45_g747 [Pleurotus djamor]
MSQVPHLTLHVPRSPLLSDLDFRFTAKTGSLLSALLTKRIISTVYDSGRTTGHDSPTEPHPDPIEYTRIDDTPARRHSFAPPLPKSDVVGGRGPSSQGVIALLNLLDSFDADVAMQVARVKDGVKEAREAIQEYRQERQARETLKQERLKEEKLATKEIGGDFWLGV